LEKHEEPRISILREQSANPKALIRVSQTVDSKEIEEKNAEIGKTAEMMTEIELGIQLRTLSGELTSEVVRISIKPFWSPMECPTPSVA
jgi:hypothetical protein